MLVQIGDQDLNDTFRYVSGTLRLYWILRIRKLKCQSCVHFQKAIEIVCRDCCIFKWFSGHGWLP